MSPFLYWAGGAVIAAGFAMALARLPARKALAVLLLAAAAGLALARQFALALPLAAVALSLWRSRGSRQGGAPSSGQISEVTTGWLEMSLDHDSGAMDGTIRRGSLAGRTLLALSSEELRLLWAEISAEGDSESLALLEAFVARHRQDAGTTQEDPENGQRSAEGTAEMTEAEAYEILGLDPGASSDEVRAAYHRLIRKVHPDSGGTSALAALINAARRRLDPH